MKRWRGLASAPGGQAFADFQSRMTISGEMFKTSAVSATVRTPKNRNSTNWPMRPNRVQLTTSGDAERPDGKYVAYIRRQGEQFSIWIRQIATGSDVKILPPTAGIRLHGLTVTPDSGFVDVVRQDLHEGARFGGSRFSVDL